MSEGFGSLGVREIQEGLRAGEFSAREMATAALDAIEARDGEVEIDHLEDGVLYVKLSGACAGCPSADITTEELIKGTLVEECPELVREVSAIQNISDELYETAKRLLRDHHL